MSLEYRVTMDMAGGYLSAVHERLPQAQIVFDRFHVQRLARDAFYEVRRAQARVLEGEQAKQVKGLRFILLKTWGDLEREGCAGPVAAASSRSPSSRERFATTRKASSLSSRDVIPTPTSRASTTDCAWWPAVLSASMSNLRNRRAQADTFGRSPKGARAHSSD